MEIELTPETRRFAVTADEVNRAIGRYVAEREGIEGDCLVQVAYQNWSRPAFAVAHVYITPSPKEPRPGE